MDQIDHLVFAVPDLQQGIELVERQTGVGARFGGQHPGRGTHNALLSLGGRQYLEIIAVDPGQASAPGLLFPELKSLRESRLIGWAVAVASIDAVARRAASANIETTGPIDGSRAQTDGTLLTWKTLRIANPRFEGIPFFIEWREDATHPSQGSPPGCRLMTFEIEHTEPEEIRRLLNGLGVRTHIAHGPRIRLKARMQTPKGDVELG